MISQIQILEAARETAWNHLQATIDAADEIEPFIYLKTDAERAALWFAIANRKNADHAYHLADSAVLRAERI